MPEFQGDDIVFSREELADDRSRAVHTLVDLVREIRPYAGFERLVEGLDRVIQSLVEDEQLSDAPITGARIAARLMHREGLDTWSTVLTEAIARAAALRRDPWLTEPLPTARTEWRSAKLEAEDAAVFRFLGFSAGSIAAVEAIFFVWDAIIGEQWAAFCYLVGALVMYIVASALFDRARPHEMSSEYKIPRSDEEQARARSAALAAFALAEQIVAELPPPIVPAQFDVALSAAATPGGAPVVRLWIGGRNQSRVAEAKRDVVLSSIGKANWDMRFSIAAREVTKAVDEALEELRPQLLIAC